MREPRPLRGTATLTMSLLMVVIGVAMIVRTVAAGGGPLAGGLLLGLLFIAAGVGRMYLARISR